MIKAILAIDDKCGVSKNGSMPWPRNLKDLEWFKNNTIGHVIVMGRKTWIDPNMPTPLKKRINVLVTSKSIDYPGADYYISNDLVNNLNIIKNKYSNKIVWIIGGPNLLEQLIADINEFYLTRIYGDFLCDTNFDINKLKKEMQMVKKIESDNTCHFEIWKK